MVPAWLLGLVGLCAAAGAGWSATRAERSSTRPVEGRDMEEIRRYSDQLGRAWLKDSLGLDLDALALEFNPRNMTLQKPRPASPSPAAGAPNAGSPQPAGISSYLSLKLEQTDDLRRLQNDLMDIPFGLSVSGQLPLLDNLAQIETRLWVPFSWRDEFRAQAQLPLLSRRLTLRSDFRNQMGFNKLEAGLGTQLNPQGLGVWGLDYDFQRRFGQGADEAIHWLKLSKSF